MNSPDKERRSERRRQLRALIDRFEAKDCRIGIAGLGYVGLPVAVSFAEVGFEVLGVDSSPERVELIRSGESHIRDV
ncbi:MAG: hypothetical protein GEU68_16465, partial [Actinobacteria bacterium]|nr:hypothetical protein [Actinomycetota bacterium]